MDFKEEYFLQENNDCYIDGFKQSYGLFSKQACTFWLGRLFMAQVNCEVWCGAAPAQREGRESMC
jgi:hypothetical protein